MDLDSSSKLKQLQEIQDDLVSRISEELIYYTPAYNDKTVINNLENRLTIVKDEIEVIESQMSH